ncbi:MAG: cell division protein FtsQ/DivIB [Phycisphaerales bacterium]
MPTSGFRAFLARAYRITATVVTLSLLGAIVAGAVIYRPLLRDAVSKLKEQPVRVEIAWPRLALAGPTLVASGQERFALAEHPATWLDTGSQSVLLRLAYDNLSPDPLDAASIRRTQAALMATGWFETPCRVTRLLDNKVVIQGDWREPVAAVRAGNRDYLVSAKGERLPPEYPPEGSGLKVLIGPERDAPRVGELWLGGDVQAGLALLNCLRRAPEQERQDILDQARAIDLSDYAATKNLYIVTDTGSRILWGGEPGAFIPGQAHDDVKLQRLARLVRDHGRIDASRDYLDISLAGLY